MATGCFPQATFAFYEKQKPMVGSCCSRCWMTFSGRLSGSRQDRAIRSVAVTVGATPG
ncbi:MAG: hypothetical protein JSR31_02750 [Nitrospira sp.]|nr:hypothetical protein [Nitrospira sp.]